MARFVCITAALHHAPRTNPWSEAIPLDPSAEPFHDQVERALVTRDRPHTAARLYGLEGRIRAIHNNLDYLCAAPSADWLRDAQDRAPDVRQAVERADAASAARDGGAGSALAQPWPLTPLPLLASRERRTAIWWGISAFSKAFGRSPEGMLLPGGAVDLETLDALAEQGILFTILRPHQIAATRPLGRGDWDSASGGVDTSRPYLVRTLEGRQIIALVAPPGVSDPIEVGPAMIDATALVDHLAAHMPGDGGLMVVPTDLAWFEGGGDTTLAGAIEALVASDEVRLCSLSAYLEGHPPQFEARIVDDTSTQPGAGLSPWDGSTQPWRRTLRDALGRLRAELSVPFLQQTAPLFKDPWLACDHYASVVLDRSEASIQRFFSRHSKATLTALERSDALHQMELQRHLLCTHLPEAQRAADLDTLDGRQVLAHAARACHIAAQVDGDTSAWDGLVAALHGIETASGARGDEVLLAEGYTTFFAYGHIGAQWAPRALHAQRQVPDPFYCFTVSIEDERRTDLGVGVLVVGHAVVSSTITLDSAPVEYAVLGLRDHRFVSGAHRIDLDQPGIPPVLLTSQLLATSVDQVVDRLHEHFGVVVSGWEYLLGDEQEYLLQSIVDEADTQAQDTLQGLYNHNASLLRVLEDIGRKPPTSLEAAVVAHAEHLAAAKLRDENTDHEILQSCLEAARNLDRDLDTRVLTAALVEAVARARDAVVARPRAARSLERLADKLDLAQQLGCDIDTWRVQNTTWKLARRQLPQVARNAEGGDREAVRWVAALDRLMERLELEQPS